MNRYDRLIEMVEGKQDKTRHYDVRRCTNLECKQYDSILMLNDNNEYFCMGCGEVDTNHLYIEHDDEPYIYHNCQIRKPVPYKRLNHLNNVIRNVMIKKNIQISSQVINKIHNTFTKMCIIWDDDDFNANNRANFVCYRIVIYFILMHIGERDIAKHFRYHLRNKVKDRIHRRIIKDMLNKL